MFRRKRKGITPVIAIVLLLLVTVGAVGVVYTQFQELVEDPDTDFLDEVETSIQSVTRQSDTVNGEDGVQIRIQNSGDDEYNLTESIRMEYSFNDDGPVEFETIGDISDLETDGEIDEICPEGDMDAGLFSPGETRTCHTGVEMPSPTDDLEIHLVQEADGEEIDSWNCSPSTSESSTC